MGESIHFKKYDQKTSQTCLGSANPLILGICTDLFQGRGRRVPTGAHLPSSICQSLISARAKLVHATASFQNALFETLARGDPIWPSARSRRTAMSYVFFHFMLT